MPSNLPCLCRLLRFRTSVTSCGHRLRSPLGHSPWRHEHHYYCRPGGALFNVAASVQDDPTAHACCVYSTRARTQEQLKHAPDFGNFRDSYRDTTTSELFRAYVIFSFCSSDFLVSKIVKILGWTRRVLGRVLYRAVMKPTIYGQFLAGDNDRDILGVAERNLSRGVNAMMAYIASEVHGAGGAGTTLSCRRRVKDVYQTNFDAVRHSIDLAAEVAAKSGTSQRQWAAAKVTFIAEPEVLRHMTDLINTNTSILGAAYRQTSTEPTKRDSLVELLNDILHQAEKTNGFVSPPAIRHLEELDDSLTTNIAFHLTCKKSRELAQFTQGEASASTLSDTEETHLNQVWKRMCVLAEHAESRGVVFAWDAEQIYLQPAIDLLLLDLMRKYSRQHAAIFHTYQCYLKSTHEKVVRDLKLSRKEDFCLAAKLVRGAYLIEERKRAVSLRYEDPTNPTYESTTTMYHRVADEFLRHIQTRPGRVEVVIATHNEATVGHVLRQISNRGLDTSNAISFAQLHGMRDYITMPLGYAGYPVYKLLNYGPVEECVAFLSRRAQENSSAIATANEERKLIGRELRRRFTSLFAARA
ncbi:hypothetical protein NP493_83g02003 [Ridgeia piscesae]|uniref:Proline dehydrogenase n=1 Tax=Ridgeia piscesae TaxID=27915 RepID=A0AAD9P8W4_RIDPI|nr:hypothetical protein NP493_83g02003 [Ridgeia piscesae]